MTARAATQKPRTAEGGIARRQFERDRHQRAVRVIKRCKTQHRRGEMQHLLPSLVRKTRVGRFDGEPASAGSQLGISPTLIVLEIFAVAIGPGRTSC